MTGADLAWWTDFKSYQPPEEDLQRFRRELVARARAVRDKGWRPYWYEWTANDVMGTALVLGDGQLLDTGDTDAALQVWACELFGHAAGWDDIRGGLVRTRAWFSQARTQLDTDRP